MKYHRAKIAAWLLIKCFRHMVRAEGIRSLVIQYDKPDVTIYLFQDHATAHDYFRAINRIP